MEKNNLNALDATRRSLLVGSGVAITALASTHAMAAVSANTRISRLLNPWLALIRFPLREGRPAPSYPIEDHRSRGRSL